MARGKSNNNSKKLRVISSENLQTLAIGTASVHLAILNHRTWKICRNSLNHFLVMLIIEFK